MTDEEQAKEEEDDLLSEEEKREKKEQKQYESMVEMSDKILNRWHEAKPEGERQSVIDGYIESGVLDHTVAGVDELETIIVEAAFVAHVDRAVLKPLGLTMDQWQEHIDDAELPAFRRAVIEGDWQSLIAHARAAAKMRTDLSL